MSRYLITVFIFILVAGTLIFGQLFINNSCDSLIKMIDVTYANLEENDFVEAEQSIKSVLKEVKSAENLNFILSDHETYDELSSNLSVARYFITHNEKSLAGAYMTLARDAAERMKDSQSFGIGNIL